MTFALRLRSLVLFTMICVLHLCRGALALESVPTREAFLKLIDRPRVDPKVDVGEPVVADGLKTSHFSYNSEENERVPGIVVYPENANTKLPVVILLHGTGGKKEDELPLMKKLAKKDCITVAIDGRYHGERIKNGIGVQSYNEAILARFKGELKSFPLYWDTVYDVMRLIDILSARDDVDGERIGVIGFSKGGIETYFLAAADTRVSVAVPCIGVQSFRYGLENNAFQGRVNTVRGAFLGAATVAHVEKLDAAFAKTFFDNIVPGIDGPFDGAEMLPLIAPRPLMIINGDSDGNTPLGGVTIVAEKTKAAYVKAGVADKFKQIVEPKTAHKVNDDARDQAIEFLAKYLSF